MTVAELAKNLDLTLAAGGAGLDSKVNKMYIGDLLSWVMGKAKEGDAWVTIQGHINIVAVAELVGASCIIVAEGAVLDANTAEKADEEGIPVLTTGLDAFETVRRFLAFAADS